LTSPAAAWRYGGNVESEAQRLRFSFTQAILLLMVLFNAGMVIHALTARLKPKFIHLH
jgi:hypothetical protein